MNYHREEESPERVSYYDEKWNTRDGEIVERNGYLILVRDSETGHELWKCNFEIA
jgi:hypothetical protein